MLEEEAELGILALEKGLISQEALNECLAVLTDRPGQSIVDLFRSKKLLMPQQIDELRAEAQKRIDARGGGAPAPVPVPAAPLPEASTVDLGSTEEAASASGAPAEAAAAMKDPSNRVGDYVKVRKIGSGTHAVVHKAWDAVQSRWVALKILKDSGGAEGVARVLESCRALADLDHDGVVRVFGSGSIDEGGSPRAYVALEYFEGLETADAVRARGGLDVNRAAEIVRDAASAVDHAHARGVIHKDIKPRNILVDGSGKVRVADFGLAAIAATLGPSEDSLLSRTIQVQGTPSYMSPEQALGRTGDIKERSDIYSLGASLYFLVTGRPPFDAGSAMKTCFAVVRDPVVPPSQINPKVASQLEQIIARAMAKDPVRRYDSARHFAEDLDRFVKGAAILTDDQLRLTQGIAALHAGRLEEAIHMFKELIKLELGGKLGGVKSALKQIEEGENGITLAIGRQTKNYDIRTQRGVYRFAKSIILSLDGHDPTAVVKAALEDFVIAAELRPEHTAARVNRSNVLIFGGRYARDSGKDVTSVFNMATKDLDSALQFDPTCSPAYHNRGIVSFYIAQAAKKSGGDPEPAFRRAIDDFSRAAELEPTYAYIFKDLGVVKIALAKHLLARGEKVKSLFEQAVAHLEMAIQLNGQIYGAYYERGQALFALKDFRASVRDFKRCIELDPSRDKKVQVLIDEAIKHAETRKL